MSNVKCRWCGEPASWRVESINGWNGIPLCSNHANDVSSAFEKVSQYALFTHVRYPSLIAEFGTKPEDVPEIDI